jgi:hypothetical protein
MGQAARTGEEARRQPRDAVEYRARATGGDGRRLSLLVVNTSAQGLMARCDHNVGVDERLRVTLPIVGEVAGVVRWALGGRIGCELDLPIGASRYHEMLRKVGHRPA